MLFFPFATIHPNPLCPWNFASWKKLTKLRSSSATSSSCFFCSWDSLDSTSATIFRGKKKGTKQATFSSNVKNKIFTSFSTKPNQSALKKNGHSPLPEVAWKIDFLPLDFEPGVFQHRWDSEFDSSVKPAPPLPACSVNSCVFRCSRAPRPIMMCVCVCQPQHNACGQATSARERLLPTKCDGKKKHFPRKNTRKIFQPVRFHSNLCRNLAQTYIVCYTTS